MQDWRRNIPLIRISRRGNPQQIGAEMGFEADSRPLEALAPIAATPRRELRPSGNLCDPRGLHHRRAPLAIRKARGLFLVCIHAPEGLAVCVVDGNKIMMVPAAAVLAELGLLVPDGFSW